MSQKLEISDTGLRLIKAFEGYRPVDRELVSGQRIVGYGHRLYSEDAVMMTKREAEEVLRSDLEPFEDMINSEVHAPITQSQFDALCSFAFNIGPKAFLQSDTLRALNNGRPLDAANSFDIWRKSEIAGKTYVVDALMRRRTAEKALFLLTERNLPAGRVDLPPVKDTTIEGLSTEDAYPVFTEKDAKKVVASAPYSAAISPARRREDGPAGVLQLSELDIVENADLPAEITEFAEDDIKDTRDETVSVSEQAEISSLNLSKPEIDEPETDKAETGDLDINEPKTAQQAEDSAETAETRTSPIAAAATDIVARLDALIDDASTEEPKTDWPETLTESPSAEKAGTAADANVIDLRSRTQRAGDQNREAIKRPEGALTSTSPDKTAPVAIIDELAADEALRPRTDSAAKYIETYFPEVEPEAPDTTNHLGLWIPVLLGFVLLGAAGGAWFRGAEILLGAWGPIIAFTGIIIGVGLILAGIYAYLRDLTRN